MTEKSKRIISIVLALIPSLMLIFSSAMKLAHAKPIVEGFNRSGLGNYITFIGIIELFSVILFLIPQTTKLGFFLLCSYLGGAICMELASGQPPMAAVFLALIWISVYMRNKSMFTPVSNKKDKLINQNLE